MQKAFSPIKHGFSWTADGWYCWDSKAGHKAALKARNALAKKLASEGHKVKKWCLPGQLVTVGGVGSNRPEIDQIVTVYMLEAF